MKKIVFLIFLLAITQNSFSQEANEKTPNNELKINLAYMLAGIPEIGYEYILDEESAVGASILYSFLDDNDFIFAFTPYYRFYFGNKRAAGFYVEGFGMLNITEGTYHVDYYDSYPEGSYSQPKDETDFALGFSIGGKFLTKKEFLFEVYGGVARNLFNNYSTDFLPRLGVTFGKRF